ncbi:unnamed protein product [Didymodactylos carnosus]|uniref:Plus3 domain-containing protein n=1 Tax=Didymodactylos carnosus TaxID=1234261 RepID=A0A8S2CUQ8_9BILA|nr:unnamed protein product [Didymodactylos carnosus]CAF3546356.1 unnamed protein product [Didymodactylos carnosus]
MCLIGLYFREEISKRLKSKTEETSVYSKEEGEIGDIEHAENIDGKHDENLFDKQWSKYSNHRRCNENKTHDDNSRLNIDNIHIISTLKSRDKKSLPINNDIYTEDNNKDDQLSNRRQANIIKQKETAHNKPPQVLLKIRERKRKMCHAPFFADIDKRVFVRINIGQNGDSPVYRIGKILDIVETTKVYQLGNIRTNKELRLKYGSNESIFRLEYVSDSEINDKEFKRWRETLIKQGISLPTIHDIENKQKAIQKYTNYSLNEKDIDQMVEEKQRFRKTPLTHELETERNKKRSESISVISTVSGQSKMGEIPRIVHFITGQGDSSNEQLKLYGPILPGVKLKQAREFELINYLCLLAARYILKPHKIYVHYYKEPKSYWWTKAKNDSDLKLTLRKTRQITSIYGHKLYHHAHRGDIMRLEVLLKYGGIYLDLDVLALNSFDSLLKNKLQKQTILGYENENYNAVCNAVILSIPRSQFLRRLYESYQSLNATCWACHSVMLTGYLATIYSQETLVLPSVAFYEPSYLNIEELYYFDTYDFRKNYASHLWNSFIGDEFLKNLTLDYILYPKQLTTLIKMIRHSIGIKKLQKINKDYKRNQILKIE